MTLGSHTIRAAVMAISADMPALRKLTQFLGHKADLGCSRCKFRAEREPGTTGATGKMSYLTPANLPASRNHDEVAKQAEAYQAAPTKASRTSLAQKNGVRYSELIRLPYLDMVNDYTGYCTVFIVSHYTMQYRFAWPSLILCTHFYWEW